MRRRNLAAERLASGRKAYREAYRRVTLCPHCGVPLSSLFPFQSARTGTRNHRCKSRRR